MTGPERLYEHMVGAARFRDRRYFGSDATAARELGVSRRTVIRWRQQLESTGRIERCGWKRWGVGKKTVVYRFRHCRVTQRLRPNPSTSCLRTNRKQGPNARGRQTYGRSDMGKEIEPRTPEVAPLDERPKSAQDVIGAVCDAFAAEGIPILGRHKGIIGKQAKECLEDGFEFETVVIAAATALRRGQPQNLHFIANDLVMARAGKRMTRGEYERALQDEMELRGK